MQKKKANSVIIGKKLNMCQGSALIANKTQVLWKSSAKLKIQ